MLFQALSIRPNTLPELKQKEEATPEGIRPPWRQILAQTPPTREFHPDIRTATG